jgi:diacylglycerol kinase (ATP)
MNLRAGSFKGGPTEQEIEDFARGIGFEIEIIDAGSPDEMREQVRRLVGAGVERLGVAGGDGTVRLAVQELAHKETALGILPMGTFNNFAAALRLPTDFPSALRLLHSGEVAQVSLGKVGDRYFTEAAGVGIFADALALYGAGTNKSFWRGLYAMSSIFFSIRPRRLYLTLDGQELEERAVMCTIANTFRMAQGLPVAPEAKLTDDFLDVVIMGNLTRGELFAYYRAMRQQMHFALPKVKMMKAREIRIETRRRMNVHADDEVISTTPATVEVQPGALRVIVDRL